MSFSEKLSLIEELVRAPTYMVLGYYNKKLLFLTTREGVYSLWYLDFSSGEEVLIADEVVFASKAVEKSPYILYTKDIERGREQHRAYLYNFDKRETVVVEDMHPLRVTGITFDGEKFVVSGGTMKGQELWRIEPSGEAEKVYETDKIIFAWSVEKNIIGGSGILAGDPRSVELFVFDMDTGEFKVVTPKEGSTNSGPMIRNSKALFSTSAYGNDRLLIYDINTGEFSEPKLSFTDYNPADYPQILSFDWLKDGKIWLIAERDGRTSVFIDGRRLNLPEGTAFNLVEGENEYFITWSNITTPTRILSYRVKENKTREVLGAKLSEKILDSIGEIKIVRYKSFDGLEIPTLVIESEKAGKPGPTIIYIHGGPFAEVSDSWSVMMASLVVSGYNVVAPNYRGSTGYGEEFRRLIIGDVGGGEFMDVVYANKWARENGIASKIAIMGYSYGGYMTLYALGREPDIWDCGVAGAAVADWEEMYNISDALFRNFIEIMFAGKKELYKERSPITYAEKLKVPICIIQPQNDTRTPLKPIINYIQKLMEHGKTFELHVIPDMGHIIVKMDDAVKILYPAIIFLDKIMRS